ncbi:MAG: hypothetical protein J5800_02825 [Spirochaetales bacterium]|nr:hypothetical protein [Spirochaetales bacterium]
MIRRLTIVGLVSLLLLTSFLYAEDLDNPPPSDDIEHSLMVIMDCISASLVTECTDSSIKLPCCNVSMDPSVHMPKRIAYFLADPSEFVEALSPAEGYKGFLASFLSVLNSATENQLVSAVYVAMATREYSPGDYLLSGSISFEYPEGATLNEVLSIWSSREDTGKSIDMTVDMKVYGKGLSSPIALSGNFNMSVDKGGSIIVKSADTYMINGYAFRGGEFRM